MLLAAQKNERGKNEMMSGLDKNSHVCGFLML